VAGRRARGARRHPPRSQHFLRSATLAAELVRDAQIGPGDLVLEIGAGRGRLTEALARVAARVIAVEVDPRLARLLDGRWPNVDVVVADAAALALPAEQHRVVSNLPFHRTTDLMHRLLDDPASGLARADLIVEWNVAVKRAVPWPSSLNGVCWGAFWETTLVRRIPRFAFAPPPSVDAGVLAIRRRAVPLVAAEQAAAYRRFVAAGFRKGLGRVTTRRDPSGAVRLPRDLDAHDWARLFHAASGNGWEAGRPRGILRG
jgi:23S rRNA (adenine-N6)-dimethyltransferase